MVRVRFAPSPTGDLHVGNGRTALLNCLFARNQHGTFILRIEDTDTERSEARFEASIAEDLQWLGLAWGEGPYRQTERLGVYDRYLSDLVSTGRAYKCFCTRDELEKHRENCLHRGLPPRYSGTCRDLPPEVVSRLEAEGRASVVRFRSNQTKELAFQDLIHGEVRFPRDHVDDFILRRQDGIPSYNFAAAVDDLEMGITHVIRGADHLSNTPKQMLLFLAFGATPPRYGHHGLLTGNDRKPLSKRHGATRVKEFRSMGILAEALVNYLGILGRKVNREVAGLEELAVNFSLASFSSSDAVFDLDKLLWLNKEHLRSLPAERLLRELDLDGSWRDRVLLVRENARTLVELRELCRLFDDPGTTEEALAMLASIADAPRVFPAIERMVSAEPGSDVHALLAAVGEEASLPRKQAMILLRIIVTGRLKGPPLDELFPFVSKDTILKRIQWLRAHFSAPST